MLGFLKDHTKENQQEMRIAELEAELERHKQALNTIEEVSIKASKGNMEARILNWDKYGDLSHVMGNLNQLLDLTDAFIREAGASLDAAQQGNYYRKFLPQGMSGNFGSGANTINKASNNMAELEEEQRDLRLELANQFEKTVMSVVCDLENSAQLFNTSAQQLMNSASGTQELASKVSSASEETTFNVQTVASASEELSSSIAEISSQVESSASKTSSAKTQVTTALDTISDLHQSSSTINDVVDLINNVAKQTNLLALNATIEAARAGEAGKGFAVVASEVKNLSKKTAEATDKIKHQVESMQIRTQNSVKKVNSISDTIENLDNIAASIASSTGEQSIATVEISKNIQEVSLRTQHVCDDVAQVYNTANETMLSATELLSSAEKIMNQTTQLNKQSKLFIEGVRNM